MLKQKNTEINMYKVFVSFVIFDLYDQECRKEGILASHGNTFALTDLKD